MPAKEKKTKAQIAAAAAAGSRSKKKKWIKEKRSERPKHSVVFDDATLEKFNKEVSKTKVITPYVVSEKYCITVSLAKRGLSNLESEGKIKKISSSAGSLIYTYC